MLTTLLNSKRKIQSLAFPMQIQLTITVLIFISFDKDNQFVEYKQVTTAQLPKLPVITITRELHKGVNPLPVTPTTFKENNSLEVLDNYMKTNKDNLYVSKVNSSLYLLSKAQSTDFMTYLELTKEKAELHGSDFKNEILCKHILIFSILKENFHFTCSRVAFASMKSVSYKNLNYLIKKRENFSYTLCH